jgi:hypothetical protein
MTGSNNTVYGNQYIGATERCPIRNKDNGIRVFTGSVYCIPLQSLTSTKSKRLSLSYVIATNICVNRIANDSREMWRGKLNTSRKI